MIYCPHCQKPSAGKSAACPHCGEVLPEKKKKKPSKTVAYRPPEDHEAEATKQDAAEKTKQNERRDAAVEKEKEQPKPAAKPRMRLGEILIGAGILSPEQLETALVQQKRLGLRLGAILVQANFITEYQLVQALSHQSGIPWFDLAKTTVDRDIAELILPGVAENYIFFPIGVRETDDGKKVLFMAMDNPTDIAAIHAAAAASGMYIEPLFAAPSAIEAAIEKYSGRHRTNNRIAQDSWASPPAESAASPAELSADNVVQRQIIIVAPEQTFPETAQVAGPVKARAEQGDADAPPEQTRVTASPVIPPQILTLLDGTRIPRTTESPGDFLGAPDTAALFAELNELGHDPASVARLKEYVIALLEILLRKHLVLPNELSGQLEKKAAEKTAN